MGLKHEWRRVILPEAAEDGSKMVPCLPATSVWRHAQHRNSASIVVAERRAELFADLAPAHAAGSDADWCYKTICSDFEWPGWVNSGGGEDSSGVRSGSTSTVPVRCVCFFHRAVALPLLRLCQAESCNRFRTSECPCQQQESLSAIPIRQLPYECVSGCFGQSCDSHADRAVGGR